MPFFSQDDYDSIGNKEKGVPDGVMDATSYYEVFKNLLSSIENLDVDSYESKVKFMMDIVNPSFTEGSENLDSHYVMNLITSMSYHLIALLTDNGDSSMYAKRVREHVLPHIEKESKAIPYWE